MFVLEIVTGQHQHREASLHIVAVVQLSWEQLSSETDCVQVQEVAKSEKLKELDSVNSNRVDSSMQRTSTAFKNRSGFRGVRRVRQTRLCAPQHYDS